MKAGVFNFNSEMVKYCDADIRLSGRGYLKA